VDVSGICDEFYSKPVDNMLGRLQTEVTGGGGAEEVGVAVRKSNKIAREDGYHAYPIGKAAPGRQHHVSCN
jgi:hypothetical protein